MTWMDGRERDRQTYLSWGWSPMEATWAAYYGKPFYAVVVGAR